MRTADHQSPNLDEIDRLFERLAASPFRSRFKLGPGERDYLAKKGRSTVSDHAADFVARRLAPSEPRNDGKQTPFRGHPVFIAQHATATCCRGCLAKWHGLQSGRPLEDFEQKRIVAVIMRWLESQQTPQAAEREN